MIILTKLRIRDRKRKPYIINTIITSIYSPISILPTKKGTNTATKEDNSQKIIPMLSITRVYGL